MSYDNYSIYCPDCQEGNVLTDVSAYGHERPWAAQKELARRLSRWYRYVDDDKANRLETCADWLGFRRKFEGGLALSKANFCRVRLCPMCQWRRALKIHGQMCRVFGALEGDGYGYVKMVLTVPNCTRDNLTETLDRLQEGFHRLIKYKDVRKIVKGYYKALEITVNHADSLHPHIHAILAVNASYFTSRSYLRQEIWRDLWEQAVDFQPYVNAQGILVEHLQLNVGRLKIREGQTITDALKEYTKYTVKAGEIVGDQEEPTDEGVALLAALDGALNKRKFMTLGGVVKDAHKALNLSDINDDGDLVRLDRDDLTDTEKHDIYYIWRSGVYITWQP